MPLVDMPRQIGLPPPFFWPVKGASKLAPVEIAKAGLEAKEEEERNRLLYVAMTRARDRLYICGFEGKNGRARGCWYDIIANALEPVLTSHELASGQRVSRMACPQVAEIEVPRVALAAAQFALQPPAWASRPAVWVSPQ